MSIPYKANTDLHSRRFYSSLATLNPDSGDTNQNLNVLTDESLHSFEASLQNFLDILKNQGENLIASMSSFANFSSFSPKDITSQIIIKSGALELMMKISDITYRPYVYRTLHELTNGNHETVLTVIHTGALGLCLNEFPNMCFSIPETKEYIEGFISNCIGSSFFSRALVYSTGIFQKFLERVEPLYDDSLAEIIVKFFDIFCHKGPSKGMPATAEAWNNCQSIEASYEFWNRFTTDYKYPSHFDNYLFNEFVQFGVDVEDEQLPFQKMLLYFFSKNRNKFITVHCLRSLGMLLSRDSNVSPFTLCHAVMNRRLPFIENFPDYIECEIVDIVNSAARIVAILYWPNELEFGNLVAQNIFECIFDFLDRNKENEVDSGLLVSISFALRNISANKQMLVNSEKLKILQNYLFNGTFKVRRSMAVFYMDHMADALSADDLSAIDTISSAFNNLVDMIDCSENDDFLIIALNNFIYLFEFVEFYDDDGEYLSRILKQFENSSGYDVVCKLLNSGNKEISDRANDFDNKYNNINVKLTIEKIDISDSKNE